MGCGASKKADDVDERAAKKEEKVVQEAPPEIRVEPEPEPAAQPTKQDEEPAPEEEVEKKGEEEEPAPPPPPVAERQVPDKDTMLSAINDCIEHLEKTISDRKAANLPTHASEDPVLILLFMGAASQIGAKYGVEPTDLMAIEETYKDDEEVMSVYRVLKGHLDACGLPSTVPK